MGSRRRRGRDVDSPRRRDAATRIVRGDETPRRWIVRGDETPWPRRGETSRATQVPPAVGRLRGRRAVQLPGHDPALDVPARGDGGQHVRPQAVGEGADPARARRNLAGARSGTGRGGGAVAGRSRPRRGVPRGYIPRAGRRVGPERRQSLAGAPLWLVRERVAASSRPTTWIVRGDGSRRKRGRRRG